MNPTRTRLGARPRPTRRLAVALAVLCCVGLGACQISWRLGTTHGAIVEPGAARASIGIWRAPTRLLADLEQSRGVDLVQDILCASGRFPVVALEVGGRGLSVDVLKARWCGYVYGDDSDLRSALRDAQRGRTDDCLALTLISGGAYRANWTHKSVGCRTGSLG
ncbi:MAG: hypothetical protein R2702_05090 [Acidimicrobiales bacterium]